MVRRTVVPSGLLVVVSVCLVVFGGSPFEDELNDELLNEKDWKVDCWFDMLN